MQRLDSDRRDTTKSVHDSDLLQRLDSDRPETIKSVRDNDLQ